MDATHQPHVVIVGSGFGGLNAARSFRDAPVRVTLVDRRNHHVFQPLLYQVATASLSPAEIASPIRGILRGLDNVHVLMGTVTAIDVDTKSAELDGGDRLTYDYLIVAAGARHSYFGHDEWESLAPGLKSLEDALEMRRRVLLAYEAAERTSDFAERQRLLSFVVVGGGPTGAELAGALGEISRFSMERDFDNIDPAQARIYLLEAGPRILAMFPEKLAKRATRYLEGLGVMVRGNALVTGIDETGVTLKDGERIPAGTILWAAGVMASPIGTSLGAPVDRAGRVLVNPDLSIPDHPEVFVVGDLMSLSGNDGKPLPGVAQVAIQEGRHAGRNVLHAVAGEPMEPFAYNDRGNMATIGRNRAIADIHGLHLSGFVAWMAWLFIHILYLIGFRNRLVVITQWFWSYVTFRRGARLITNTGYRAGDN